MDAFLTSRVMVGRIAHAMVRFVFLCSLFSSTLCYAAVQGTTGTDSTGSVDIHYVQGLVTRINGFADFDLGTWGGSGPLTANDNLCIGRSAVPLFGTGIYRIRAAGDGEPGDPSAFTLTNGVNQISYNAYFNDSTGTAGRTQLTPGVTLTGQSGFGLSFFFNMVFTCAWQNANLSIEVPESELSGAAGSYTGTLTLTLIPE